MKLEFFLPCSQDHAYSTYSKPNKLYFYLQSLNNALSVTQTRMKVQVYGELQRIWKEAAVV
jgi:hypothetical protein